MTDQQYNALMKDIGTILDNQVILGNKLNALRDDLSSANRNIKQVYSELDDVATAVKRIKNGLKI